MTETVINTSKLSEVFDRACRESGFLDYMPGPMIGHFVRQVLPSSVKDGGIHMNQFYNWVRQEYSIPDHVFSRVFSRMKDYASELGLKLVPPDNYDPGLSDAVHSWLQSELKEVVYADLKEELRDEVREDLLKELRPEVHSELRREFEKEASPRYFGPPAEELEPIDAEGVEGAELVLRPIEGPVIDAAAERRRIEEMLRSEIEKELREKLWPMVQEELSQSLRAQLEPRVAAELKREMRERVETELRESVEARMRQEMYPVLHETVAAEVRGMEHKKLAESMRDDLEKKVRDQLRRELWDEVREEVKDDLRSVLRPVLEAELKKELAPPSIGLVEEVEGGEDFFVASGHRTLSWPEPEAERPPGGPSALDQLDLIRRVREEVSATVRREVAADLSRLAALREEEERRSEIERKLSDPEHCLAMIGDFLFPDQPGQWERIKPFVNPDDWKNIVRYQMGLAGQEMDLSSTRQAVREALKLKAEISRELEFPRSMAEDPAGKERLAAIGKILAGADQTLDFTLADLRALLTEMMPERKTG